MTELTKLEAFQCKIKLAEFDWAYIKGSVIISNVLEPDLLYLEQNALTAIKTNAKKA